MSKLIYGAWLNNVYFVKYNHVVFRIKEKSWHSNGFTVNVYGVILDDVIGQSVYNNEQERYAFNPKVSIDQVCLGAINTVNAELTTKRNEVKRRCSTGYT